MAERVPRELTAFGPKAYEALLSELLDQGYRSVGLHDLDAASQHMFVRHDIDLCPERALKIARSETAMGVRATYYFLVSTPLYSIFSAENRSIIRQICALGHEIGLHFDAECYAASDLTLDEAAEFECSVLEQCSGQAVRSISFHRPAPQYLNRAEPIAGRRHCYEPAFFSGIGYISDSNGGWHHGHPLDHPAVQMRSAIQLLTHPIWWCNSTSTPTVVTVERFFSERSDALQAALAGTVTAFRQALEDRSRRE